jgi:peptide/nickel transport system permease protein
MYKIEGFVMVNYYIKRVAHAVGVFLIVTTVAFALIRLMPFGPMEMVRLRVAQQMSTSGSFSSEELERVNQLVEVYTNINPNKSIPEAYVGYMIEVVVYQDFGRSIYFSQPVTELLLDRMQWSLFISVYGLALGRTTSLLFGAVMAYNESSLMDQSTSTVATLLSSVPFYIVAIILVWILGFQQGWFPTSGRVGFGNDPGTLDWFVSVLHHAALPVISVVLAGFGNIALQMRGNSISVLGKDFVRVGRLRGLSDNHLAVLPMYTSFMISIGFMFGGSVILERIFTYPGLGLFLFRAINGRDIPLMMGTFILITTAVAIGIFSADLTYGRIDPRASAGETSESY